jgi:hypothetical protein
VLVPVIRRGGLIAGLLSWILGIIMFLNGVGHLAGSLYFQKWLPGTTSAPVLLVASILLLRTARRR